MLTEAMHLKDLYRLSELKDTQTLAFWLRMCMRFKDKTEVFSVLRAEFCISGKRINQNPSTPNI